MIRNIIGKTFVLIPVAGIILSTDLFPLPYWFGYIPAGDMTVTYNATVMNIPIASTFLVVSIAYVGIHLIRSAFK